MLESIAAVTSKSPAITSPRRPEQGDTGSERRSTNDRHNENRIAGREPGTSPLIESPRSLICPNRNSSFRSSIENGTFRCLRPFPTTVRSRLSRSKSLTRAVRSSSIRHPVSTSVEAAT